EERMGCRDTSCTREDGHGRRPRWHPCHRFWTVHRAGPLAAVMLGDQGADVIHVDPPGGPCWQHPAEAFLNRGKRRITLDLKTAAGVATAQRLINSADVVIENFRPGVMDRLGRGYEALWTSHLNRFYRAQDRCFFVAARPAEASRLYTIAGLHIDGAD